MNVLRSLFEMQMQMTAPHTYNALQKLVMAMADVANNVGKKTFFGRDRAKLGFSAQAYGSLVGVTGQTIYNWEQGKSRPRPEQLEAIAVARALSKREAAEKTAAI